jgi:iron complex outermembrane receptor protein
MVFVRRPGLFDNSREARAHGAELEWEQQLGDRLKLQANASWANEEDDRNLSEVIRPTAPAADWLGNLALLWRPTSGSLFTARFSHVGERHASSQPEGYDLVDLAVTRHDLFARGLRLRAGVKNVFDSDVRYIVALPGFEAALPFPGRTFWAQLGFSR